MKQVYANFEGRDINAQEAQRRAVERSRQLAAQCQERAHAALEGARLTDGQLSAIADWVVARRT